MRYFKVPEPIELWDHQQEKVMELGDLKNPVSLSKYMETFVFVDPALGKGRKVSKAIVRCRKALRNVGDDGIVGIESSDWDILKKGIEDPQRPANMSIISQLDDFQDAICEAVEDRSELESKPEAVEAA